jgi:membrane-bound metal-dependent hydrolase YbcI (DUF457 family)
MDWILPLAGAASLAVLLPAQLLNSRRTWAPIEVRAALDTSMHGLAPAAAVLPLAAAAGPSGWAFPLAAFLCGFLLDLDHVLAFRSLSLKTCSTQERRPFGHGLAAVALGAAGVGLASGSAPLAAVAAFALASHVLFDATDGSGVPLLHPHRWILRRVPFAAYAGFVAAGLAAAALLAR